MTPVLGVSPTVPAVAGVIAGATVIGAVSMVLTAPKAKATPPGPILVLLQNGESNAPETASLRSAGYSVTQVTPSTWEGMSATAFDAYAALVIGDPSSGSCSSLTPTTGTSGGDALGTNWQSAVTGNVAVLGTAPALPGTSGANGLITAAVGYAAAAYSSSSSTGTGLYESLNCEYSTASAGTQVPLLNGVEGIGTTGGLTLAGGLTCSDPGTVNTWEADSSGSMRSVTNASLTGSSWPSPSCPVQEAFDSWPANFTPVAYDAASDATKNFTASDGSAGQPYILLGTPPLTSSSQTAKATLALAPSTGGLVPSGAEISGDNGATPGLAPQTDGDGVNTVNGDFAQVSGDASIPTFGPPLNFVRIYDEQQARAGTETGTPGPFGYGWTDNWATSVATGRPAPGDIYTIDGAGPGNGVPALSEPLSGPGAVVISGGNTYIADAASNRIVEVAGTAHTEWGISMSAGGTYVIAGSPTGVAGYAGSGAPASSSLLDDPQGLAVDGSGNVYIADTGNNRVLELVATSGQNRGFGSMTVNHVYTIAGHSSASPGHSGDGSLAQSAFLDQPYAVSTGHGNSDIYIADTQNNRIQEIPAENGTQWGQPSSMTAWDIYTVTGSATGTAGISGDGGAAGSAFLNGPSAITFSAGGDMYIADTQNNRIQEIPVASGQQWGISPSFTADDIYTVAGSATGSSGHSGNGTVATGALLNEPTGVVAFNSTQLYITDVGDSRVQEVARTGHTEWGIVMTQNKIYTIAGTGTAGFSGDGGTAISAKLAGPETAWLDPSFNLYIADSGNYRVRQVSASTGDISEYAGDGQTFNNAGDGGSAVAAGLNGPLGVTTDAQGDIFIADAKNNRVQEIAASTHTQFSIPMTAGDVYTVAGSASGQSGSSGDGGSARNALLATPSAVATDSAGNLYIADSSNYRVQKVAASTGNISTFAGSANQITGVSGDGGPAISAFLGTPQGLAVDAAGDVYIADTTNNRIQEVPAVNGHGMTAGDIYTVAGSAGGLSGSSGDGGAAISALLFQPWGVAVDAAGDLYIADSDNDRVREVFATGGSSWNQHMTAGDIYTIAGTGTFGYAGDNGPATQALLGFPTQIASDASGNLYIADASNSRVQEISAGNGTQWSEQMTAGDIYTVAGSSTGQAGESGDGGPAASALIDSLYSIAIDSSGDLLIPDYVGNTLREVADTSSTPLAVSPPATGVTVSQPGGAQVTFYPVGSGCASGYVEVPSNQYCSLPQDIGANLSSDGQTFTFSPQPGAFYHYNSQGQLASLSDLAGETVTIGYGTVAPGSGNCLSTANWCELITAANGRTETLGYNSSNLVTSLADPIGRRFTYGYTGSLLTSVTDALGNKTTYTYGAGSTGNPLLANDLLTITGPNAQPGGPDAGDSEVNVYDSQGRVTSQTDPSGAVTTFNYCVNATSGDCMNEATGNGDVTVTDADGNKTVYNYDQEIATAVTTWNGTSPSEDDVGPSMTADASSGGTLLPLWSVDPDGSLTSDSYDQFGNNTSETDALGNTTTTWSNSFGAVTCAADATAASPCSQSQQGPASVAPGGAITPPTSAPPAGVSYEAFDTHGNSLYTTTGVYPPGGNTASAILTNYTLYSGNSLTLNGSQITCSNVPPSPSLPCADVESNGTVTQYKYDSAGDLISVSSPDGNGSELSTVTMTYDGDGEQTSATAPDGNLPSANAANFTSTAIYDSAGELTSVTAAGGTGATIPARTVTYQYDADGNQTSATDARGFTSTVKYNANDDPTLTTDADGNSLLMCYDGVGNLTQSVPPSGVAANNLTPASCPASYPSGYGQRLATDATTDTFDASGDNTSRTTPAPAGQTGYETTSMTYDPAGLLIQESDPPVTNGTGQPNQVSQTTYNADHQVVSQTVGYGSTSPSTVSYCYDPNGSVTSVVAADGNTTSVAPCNTSTSHPYVVDPSAYPTQASFQTTYTYDSAGDEVSTTSPATAAAPSGATSTLTYNSAGQLATSTDPNGITSTYTYSPASNVSGISYSGSSAHSVSYTYDAGENLTGMSDGTGSTSYVYDPYGQLTSVTNGAGQTTSYGYNADGLITSVGYPLPASATWATSNNVTYAYDHAGMLTSVTDFNGRQSAITNTADGLPISMALGSSGDTVNTSYDQTGSPSDIKVKNSTSTLLEFAYSDAPSGDILTETDTPNSAQSPTYTYDPQGRISTAAVGNNSPTSYGFDASGNLTTLPTGASTQYDNAGELTSATLGTTTTSYTYDADGQRLTGKQGTTTVYSGSWNGANELTSYSDPAAIMTSASYDANGMRQSDMIGGTAHNFTWGGTQLLMDGTNAYVYAGQAAPYEQVNLSTGAVSYLGSDAIGSVRGVFGTTGALTASTSYDAWGNPGTAGGLTSYTPFGYAGSYTDPTGLLYNVARYYDPGTGQFLSVDPNVGQTGEPYGYAGGNPVSNTDPLGQTWGPGWITGLPWFEPAADTEADFREILAPILLAKFYQEWRIHFLAAPFNDRIVDIYQHHVGGLNELKVGYTTRGPLINSQIKRDRYLRTQAPPGGGNINERIACHSDPFGNCLGPIKANFSIYWFRYNAFSTCQRSWGNRICPSGPLANSIMFPQNSGNNQGPGMNIIMMIKTDKDSEKGVRARKIYRNSRHALRAIYRNDCPYPELDQLFFAVWKYTGGKGVNACYGFH